MSDFLEQRSIILATEIINTVSYGSSAQTMNTTESRFSPDAPPFQSKIHSGLINNPEPPVVEQDATPSTSAGDYGVVNDYSQMTVNEPSDEQMNDDLEKKSGAESAGDRNVGSGDSGNDRFQLFKTINVELVEKCLSAANYYVSMLTREQRNVLRSIRPAVLYAFLVEVAKVRSERQRRFVIDECAFCKNNGENEEFYLSHVLKDSRGRVLCPVLRAFRCPRCGATGDRAHTIKYCPQRSDGLDRNGCFSRRHGPASPPSVSLGLGRAAEARRFIGESFTRPAADNAEDWFSTIGLN